MQPALRPWHAVLRLNTDLALNRLGGPADEEASRPGTNPLSLVPDDARGIDDFRLPPPLARPALLGTIAFLMQHESYHVGQMGLLRKELGHPAMAYIRRPE